LSQSAQHVPPAGNRRLATCNQQLATSATSATGNCPLCSLTCKINGKTAKHFGQLTTAAPASSFQFNVANKGGLEGVGKGLWKGFQRGAPTAVIRGLAARSFTVRCQRFHAPCRKLTTHNRSQIKRTEAAETRSCLSCRRCRRCDSHPNPNVSQKSGRGQCKAVS